MPPGAFTAQSEEGSAALLRTPDATGTRRPLHRRTRSALRRAAVPHARLRLAWDARTLSGPKARLRRAYWEPSRRVVSTRAAKPTRSSNPGCQLTVDREVRGASAALNCSPKARISDPIGSVVPREALPSMWDSSAAQRAACYTVKAPATLRTVSGVEEGGTAVLRLRRKCTRRQGTFPGGLTSSAPAKPRRQKNLSSRLRSELVPVHRSRSGWTSSLRPCPRPA